MKTNDQDSIYDDWLARRRTDFNTVDLSLLVMKSVRTEAAPAPRSRPLAFSYLGMPSSLVGAARLILFFFLILTPA